MIGTYQFMFEGGDPSRSNQPTILQTCSNHMAKEIKLEDRSNTCCNVRVGGDVVGQYYVATNRLVMLKRVSEAAEDRIKELCKAKNKEAGKAKVTSPPPKIPESHKRE